MSGEAELPASAATPAPDAHGVSLRQAFVVWCRIAASSFGGPAGQIAVMHRIIVEEKHWISETRFLQGLNFCMLLPGPEAQQLATYIGWLMHRKRGGLIAGGLFVLPGAVSILALSAVYARFGQIGVIGALFFGLKAAVLAIVLDAVRRIGKRALKSFGARAIATAAFICVFFFAAPFPAIVAAAGVIGSIFARTGVDGFSIFGDRQSGAPVSETSLLSEATPAHARPSAASSTLTAATCLSLWLAPVAFVAIAAPNSIFGEIGLFFVKTALVTFGGAYAALAYVAQQSVEHFHWLRPGEMLDGLGMAETTPGPLIMVLQFVGFLAAYRAPGGLSPMAAGVAGAALTTWVTFAPCFLWIFVGGPFIEILRSNRALAGALTAIAAAVVGVILNLAIWFSIHTIFREVVALHGYGFSFDAPVPASIDVAALLLACAAIVAIFRFGRGVATTLAACAFAGVGLFLFGWR